MKFLYPLFLLVFIFKNSFSQDTIRFTNNELKVVKVTEVGIDQIKYLRFDNLTGPTYTTNKYDVQSIKYANGHIDTFEIKQEPPQVSQPKTAVNTISSTEKIIIDRNKLIFLNKPMGEARLWKVISQQPNGPKKDILIKEYQNMKSYKKRQYLFGFVGLGVGVAAAYVGLIGTMFTNDPTPILGGMAVGVACGITGAIISGTNKKARLRKKVEIAEIYNN